MNQFELWLCVVSPLRDENHRITLKKVKVSSIGFAQIELEEYTPEGFRRVRKDELDRNLSKIPSKQYIAFSYDHKMLVGNAMHWLVETENTLNEQRKCVQKTRELFCELEPLAWEVQ